HRDHEPGDCAVASWTAPVLLLWRFWLARLHRQSARGLAHCSKTWRGSHGPWRALNRFPARIVTLNLPGKSKAPQGRRTPKPGGSSGDLGQRASVVECGGPPPLSKEARTRNTCGSWKARTL